jgi:hypothetical protein
MLELHGLIDSTDQQQQDQHYDYRANDAAWRVSPRLAMRPTRKDAEKN